jgi:hypothetical protein
MGYRFISRRRFIGNSIAGGLAVSLGLEPNLYAELRFFIEIPPALNKPLLFNRP